MIATYIFVGFTVLFSTVMLLSTLTLVATGGNRPRWYIACLRSIGKRIGLE